MSEKTTGQSPSGEQSEEINETGTSKSACHGDANSFRKSMQEKMAQGNCNSGMQEMMATCGCMSKENAEAAGDERRSQTDEANGCC